MPDGHAATANDAFSMPYGLKKTDFQPQNGLLQGCGAAPGSTFDASGLGATAAGEAGFGGPPASALAGGQLEPVPKAAVAGGCVAGSEPSAGTGFPMAPVTDGGETKDPAFEAGQLVPFGTTLAVPAGFGFTRERFASGSESGRTKLTG